MVAPIAVVTVTVETLNERIGDFADLVGLVLVLVTLFTQQRSGKIPALEEEVAKKREWNTEIALDAVLFLVTLALFLVGLPLFLECLEGFHPRSDAGPLRGAFVIVWMLLIALMIWQVSLVRGAWKGRSEWVKEHKTKKAPVAAGPQAQQK